MMLALTVADRLALTGELDADLNDDVGALRMMSRTECYDLLRTRTVGRLAYVAREGVPDIVPVNYVLDGDDMLIRSGPGPKLQAAERRDRVAVEVDVIDEATHTGRSVVVMGRAERLRPGDTEGDPTPWASGPRRHVIRVRPDRVTGRRLG